MAEKDRVLGSLRVWVATAWADGVLAEAEREALRRLIGYAAIPADYRTTAYTWLEDPIALDVGELHELSEVRRLFIYRVAAALTRVDVDLDATEQRLLDKLCVALEVDPSKAGDIEIGVAPRRDGS